MKLKILQNKLKQGLNIVEKITTRSTTLPILNNVLLKAEKNFLELASTDLEIGIRFWILAKIEQEGSITIPMKVLSNFVNLLKPSSLDLEVKNQILHIEDEETKSQIKGFDSKDFPIIPKIEKQDIALLPCNDICQGLSQIMGICSPSTIRPEISGVHFAIQKQLVKMAATDSFRLGEKTIYFKEPVSLSKDYKLILPQKTVSHLVSVFGDKDSFTAHFSPNLIMFETQMLETEHPKIQLVSKLIEGEYPNYEEIIPKQYKTESEIEKEEFLKQLKTAGIFAGRINEVKIGFDPQMQKIKIFCQNPDLGEHLSYLSAKIKGEKKEISFNYKFLLDGLESIKSKRISFFLSEERENEEGPALLKPIGDETYLYVVMPIQAS